MNRLRRQGTVLRSGARSRAYAEAGFSVIEVMISLVVGLVVVAGVSQVYLGTKQTYRLNEARSRMQEDGRFAMEYLVRNIRLAGYKSTPLPNQPEPFPGNSPADIATPNFETGQVITGLYGGAGAADSSRISVRFLGRSRDANGIPVGTGGTLETSVKDCLGREVAAGVSAINSFVVDTVNHELQCTAVNPTPGVNPTMWTQPLVSGFGNFLVLFGIDTDDDPRIARSANRYLKAHNMGANWLNITSVRIRFDLRSAEDNVELARTTYTFNGATFTDRRLVRHFETTISLRNSLP